MINLPINKKELDTIISALRLGGDSSLYQKLLMYRNNDLYQNNSDKK